MDTRGPWELAGEDADGLLVGLSCISWFCRAPEAGTIPSQWERGPWGHIQPPRPSWAELSPGVCVYRSQDHRHSLFCDFPLSFCVDFLHPYMSSQPHTFHLVVCFQGTQAGCVSARSRATLDWGQGTPCGFPPLHSMTTRIPATGLGEALVVKGCLDWAQTWFQLECSIFKQITAEKFPNGLFSTTCKLYLQMQSAEEFAAQKEVSLVTLGKAYTSFYMV